MENAKSIISHLEQLRPFVESVTTAKVRRNNYFSPCLRASFSKAFDFVDHAFKQTDDDLAFFRVAALRSICEDIIYLSLGATLSPRDRETIIKGLMLLEVHNRINQQVAFFRKFRPFQSVLNVGVPNEGLEKTNDELRAVWQANGWRNIKRGRSPTTREIAEKVDPGVLGIVYDYIFRLTSSLVHFSPQVLFRTGWGDVKGTMTFSTRNMNPYFVALSQVYGIFLFCLYFEYFGRFLRPGTANQSLVAALRKDILMRSRWPEMVTFEEMNVELPDTNPFEIVGRLILSDQLSSGFLSTARK